LFRRKRLGHLTGNRASAVKWLADERTPRVLLLGREQLQNPLRGARFRLLVRSGSRFGAGFPGRAEAVEFLSLDHLDLLALRVGEVERLDHLRLIERPGSAKLDRNLPQSQ